MAIIQSLLLVIIFTMPILAQNTNSKESSLAPEATKQEDLTAGDNENTAPQSATGISIPLSVAPIHEIRPTTEDRQTAEASVRALDNVDPESIVVMGGSGGASMTLDLISRTTVNAAIAGEPASVIFAGMLTKPSQDRKVRYEAINDPKAFWTPKIIAKVRDKVSRFQTPLLILHGDIHPLKNINMDYIIPEIKKAEKTLEVKIYPGKNHGFYWGTRVDSEFIDGMVQDIQAFAEGYLKTKPRAITQKLYSAK